MASTPLNSLHAFLSVARRKSYAAAAKDLGVSTSALSQAVRSLEERLGGALLTRTSRSVAPTDVGQRLLEQAGPAVEQALEALKGVTAPPGEVSGRIRLTVPSTAVELILAPLLPRFLARHPRVTMDVRVEGRMVDIVSEGLDAGIRLIESIDRDMVHVRLSPPGRYVVAAAPSYLKRRGVPQKPTDLLQHDCICMRWRESGDPWAWELERGKRLWRVPVRGPVITNDAELMRALARSGVGLLYALESSIERDLARGRLRLVLDAYAPSVPGLFLFYPSRAQVSPALKAFVDFLRQQPRKAGRDKRRTLLSFS